MGYSDPAKRREWEMERWHRRRNEWFDGKSCALCGSSEKLQLDHIDPTSKIAHNVWLWGDERRERELAKCQPLCFSCHNEKHNGSRKLGHGSESNYSKRKCRCDECRAAKYRQLRRSALKASHGTSRRYEAGCKCDLCRSANAAKRRRYLANKRNREDS